MRYVTENQWEWQEKLKKDGYRLIAPMDGCFRNKEDAEEIAIKYNDVCVVCHTYGGRGRGYMVYAK